MTETEIDVVAEELARLGGTSWYPGRSDDPVLRVVTERFRDRARAAIAALDRYRLQSTCEDGPERPVPGRSLIGRLRVGATVIYRPPGDRRAYSCIVDQVDRDLIHLIPQLSGADGWIRDSEIVTADVLGNLGQEKAPGARRRSYRPRRKPETGQAGGQAG